MAETTCVVDGCEKPVTRSSDRWCFGHYRRWKKYGVPTFYPPIPRCTVDGCDGPGNKGRQMCSKHYAAWRRTEGVRRCSIDGCDRPHFGRGWCMIHYDRWRASGDPLVVSVIVGDDDTRFWSYVEQHGPDECAPWTGTITHEGYGVFQIRGRQVKAHRHAYELLVRPLAGDETIDHLCHTNHPSCPGGFGCPHRRCCNTSHHEPVSADENIRRGVVRRVPKTHCKRGHPFDEANTHVNAAGHRKCRACHRECEQRRRDRGKAA